MKPKVFIGSSREGLAIANAIHSNLTHEAECTVWNQGIFNLSQTTLHDLIRVLRDSDFGIFVFSADDVSIMRGGVNSAVRDNVIFELGLFIGRLGPERSFFLIPDNDKDLRLPTDLAGINAGLYEGSRSDNNWYAALGPACSRIAAQMAKLKTFQDTPLDEEVPAPKVKADAKKTLPKKERLVKDVQALDGEGITAKSYKNMILLEGNTKPCKEILKGVKGRWIQSLNGWTVDPSVMPNIMHQLPKIKYLE